MTLKINFESDIKGFERVQKALEAQEKVLNQNADAVDRMAKAQAGLSGQAMDVKGMESLKGSEKQIKNLAEALDHLSSKRSGIKGFMGMFSEFGSEIKKLNADSSVKIFKTMNTQIDALKNNMRGTSSLMKDLRQEIDTANAEGRGVEASKKTKQLDDLSVKQQTEGDMLQKLQQSALWRKPFAGGVGQPPGGSGGMEGFLGGGTSMQRLATIAGTMAVAAKAMQKISQFAVAVNESKDRGEIATFNREVSIASNATQGNIGRKFLLDRGLGRESELLKEGTGFWDSADMGFRQLFNPSKSGEEILNEKLNEKSKLDAKKIKGLNDAATFELGLAMDPTVNSASLQYGDDTVRKFLKNMAKKGITVEESKQSLTDLSNLGILDQVEGEALLARDPSELMMDRKGASEFRRKVAFDMKSKGLTSKEAVARYEEDLGRFRKGIGGDDVPVGVMTELTSFAQGIQSGIVGRESNLDNLAAPAQMAQAAIAGTTDLNAQEQATVATTTQSNLQKSIGSPMSAMGMASDFALIRLGVRNKMDRAAIANLLEKGDSETAAKLAAKLSGKSVEEVKAALNLAVKTTRDLQDRVSGSTPESAAIYKELGLGGRTQFMLTGETTGAMATDEADSARRGANLFGGETEGDFGPQQKERLPRTVRRETTGREIRGSRARDQESVYLEANKLVADALGEDIKNVLTSVISGGYLEMGLKLKESIGSINDSKPTQSRNPSPGRPSPVMGGQKEKEDTVELNNSNDDTPSSIDDFMSPDVGGRL